jgi:CHASE3 domain sensor protein
MNLRSWRKINLRVRIYTVLTALVAITLVGGLIMVWYTYRMESLLADLVDKNLAAYQAAEALESALIPQKGDVSHFILDGDPQWLEHLEEYRKTFTDRLDQARALTLSESQKPILDRIESEYLRYKILKDQVIEFYKAGDIDTGARLHKEVGKHFSKVLQLCRQYKEFYTGRIALIKEKSYAQAERLRLIAGTAVLVVLLLGVVLALCWSTTFWSPCGNWPTRPIPGQGRSKPETRLRRSAAVSGASLKESTRRRPNWRRAVSTSSRLKRWWWWENSLPAWLTAFAIL